MDNPFERRTNTASFPWVVYQGSDAMLPVPSHDRYEIDTLKYQYIEIDVEINIEINVEIDINTTLGAHGTTP